MTGTTLFSAAWNALQGLREINVLAQSADNGGISDNHRIAVISESLVTELESQLTPGKDAA